MEKSYKMQQIMSRFLFFSSNDFLPAPIIRFLFVSEYFGNGFLKEAITIINDASSRNIHIPATNDV